MNKEGRTAAEQEKWVAEQLNLLLQSQKSSPVSGMLDNVSTGSLIDTKWSYLTTPYDRTAINTAPVLINTMDSGFDPHYFGYSKPEDAFKDMLHCLFDKEEMIKYIIDMGFTVNGMSATYKTGDGFEVTASIADAFCNLIRPKFKNMLLSKQVLKFKL